MKFFGRIRRVLFTENKISKYLLYAAGEIILVVLGILIALQINNNNEQKKLFLKEKEALTEIISDIDNNILSINQLLFSDEWNIDDSISSLAMMVDYMESNKEYHDSLDRHFNRINRYLEVSLKSSGFESLTSIGMDLVSNAELRSKIGKYFSSTITETKVAYTELRDDYYHYMLDYLRFDFSQEYMSSGYWKIKPRNFENLKSKKDFIESLKILHEVNTYYKNELKTALSTSEEIKSELENHINSL